MASCSPMASDSGFVNPFLRHEKSDNNEDPETKKSIQKEILDIFGVDHRPRPSLFYRDSGKEISARKYMIDLYNSVTQDKHGGDVSDDDATLGCNGTLNETAVAADTVVSFVNHGEELYVLILSLCHL